MPRVRRELRDAVDALSAADVIMAETIARWGPPRIRRPVPVDQRFAALVRTICFQQIAGRAADAIHGRVVAALDARVTAAEVLALGADDLRGCGLTGAKTRSILDLAARVTSGSLRLDQAGRWPDERVIAELTQVWGIGEWTAQMFMMFELGHLDVWPAGDLGVRKGWAIVYSLDAVPDAEEIAPMADPLSPYRSVAAWYCWRAVEPVPFA